MMFQFTGSFSSCIRLIFVLFDQLQRHAASRVIASRVKCNPTSFDTFSKWVNDPAFIDRLKEAAKDPKSSSSIKLLNKLNVHIKSCTSRIPFTASQRAASLSNLIGMRYMFGLPSVFFTYAPDDVNGTLNIRLSLPQKDNNNFPADGTGLSEAIQNSAAAFQEVPITPHHLRFLLAKGPLAAAEIFRLLTETVFTTLLGTPTEHSSKKTVPLPSRKSGVFGVPIASFGCVEEQARGSLHLHVVYWGSLPCHLLQNSAIYPELLCTVAKAIDEMFKAEVVLEAHVEQLIDKFNGVNPVKPSLLKAHHPIRNPEEFNQDVQKIVAMCNCHSHSHTCHAGKFGKTGCRMRRPQTIVNRTMCSQILPADDSNGHQSYKLLEVVHPPESDSQRSRNISRIPIPLRDKRLLMWELMRRSFPPIESGNSSTYIIYFHVLYLFRLLLFSVS